jgi:internalin A
LHAFPRLERLLLKEGQASDECLAAVGRLTRLKRLYCWDARLATDAGVAHLGNLQNLEYIHISQSNLTDNSLSTFGQLRKLEGLALQGNAFTDAGLAHLQGLDKLTDLWVNMGESHMSDAGLGELDGLSSLELLAIQGDITEEAVLELQRKLPNLKTVYR